MKYASILLTPLQKGILCSDEKHLIIRGPYGSGKSIIVFKKMEMLLKELEENKKNEIVHFICYDSKSALLKEVENTQSLKIHGNEQGKKLSELVKYILKYSSNEKVNLFVDEYDGETLDKEEANTLNGIFEEKFQDTLVYLVLQSMVKERKVNSKQKTLKSEKNMFHLLKTMETRDLDLAMRNPIQINNLIRVTQNFLRKQETIYQYPSRKDTTKISTKLNEKSSEEQQSFNESEDTGEKTGDAKNQEQIAVRKLEPDEFFAIAKLPVASKDDQNIIINQFTYGESKGIGHNIKSDNPELFEMIFECTENDSFEKLCVLNCIFQKLNIHNSNLNNKHVILHFDTSTDETPELLTSTFKHLKIFDKVTNNYEKFKRKKSILVCYFRLFRGLEHSNVTVLIDQNMYNMQHYLVEVMARSTNKLSIVVLYRSDALSKITAQWEDELNGQQLQLIDQWKVCKSTGGQTKDDFYEDKTLNHIAINCSSKNHEELRKKFCHKEQTCFLNVEDIRLDELAAEEFIRER